MCVWMYLIFSCFLLVFYHHSSVFSSLFLLQIIWPILFLVILSLNDILLFLLFMGVLSTFLQLDHKFLAQIGYTFTFYASWFVFVRAWIISHIGLIGIVWVLHFHFFFGPSTHYYPFYLIQRSACSMFWVINQTFSWTGTCHRLLIVDGNRYRTLWILRKIRD